MPDYQTYVDWLDAQIRARWTWLETHGQGTKRPWPESDIEAKRHGLRMMEELRSIMMNLRDGGEQGN